MNSGNKVAIKCHGAAVKDDIEKRLVFCAFLGFVLVSALGVLLRALFVVELPGIDYSFILHSHSHFAFSGWIFLSLTLLIVKAVSPRKVKDYRLFFILTLVCSFGMLVSFALQGYKTVSIAFSTAFIFLTYYFTFKICRDKDFKVCLHPTAFRLIKAALVFLCVSSLGPFALGPLVAAGLKSSSFYNNAIYFYLHFQMNGWMLLAAFGLTINSLVPSNTLISYKWLKIFIISTIPAYFLFTLWSSPPMVVRLIAFLATLLNLVSWAKINKHLRLEVVKWSLLVKAALIAISLKVFFQVLTCLPFIGEWVFANRNLIIGYVHLLTLGSVMPMLLAQFNYSGLISYSRKYQTINYLFVFVVMAYLSLLFAQPALLLIHITIPALAIILLGIAILFLLIGIAYMLVICIRNN